MTMQLHYHATPHPGSATDILPASGATNPANVYNGPPGSSEGGYYHYPAYNAPGGKTKFKVTAGFVEGSFIVQE